MIVKLKAPLKHYLWGGTKLKTDWNKQCAEDTVAESWELSFCEQSPSVVASGKHVGKPITEVAGQADWGKNCNKFCMFPTLVKLIDTQQNLSVQVHPSDSYALEKENQFGKTEMWHILDVQPGAKIYLGLKQSMTQQQFLQAVQNKTICSCLNEIAVQKGQTYFVPSGTFHAIGAGVTLLEVQQNSTLTYRVYDFDRLDVDGKPRQLHLDKAMQVANLDKYQVPNPCRDGFLGSCTYFSTRKMQGETSFCNKDSFVTLTVVEGEISLNDLQLCKGDTAFVSAGEKVDVTGDGSYVCTCVE